MTISLLPVMLLASLGAALVYFWNPDGVIERQDFTAGDQQSLAKTYLIGTRSLSYDEQGALAEILEASEVRHFAKQKYSLIASPRLYSHNGNNQTWSATADSGRYHHNRELLALKGNVVLTNDRNNGHLKSATMDINLRTKMAISKVPVIVTQGAHTTRAGGMVANLNTEKIRMMPNVESIYVPVTP